MLIEIFLKFLICIVNIELLKVINLRGEKKKNIQQVSLGSSLFPAKVKKNLHRKLNV